MTEEKINQNLENILDEKSRIEVVIEKFLPNLSYWSESCFNWSTNERRVRHRISDMNVQALDNNQQAIAFNYLGKNYMKKALLKSNNGLSTIARWNGFHAPDKILCSDEQNNNLNAIVEATGLFSALIGLGGKEGCPPERKQKWFRGECEDLPIYAFKEALEDYLGALGCFEAISPELRPSNLCANTVGGIIEASQRINIPDDILKNWGYLFKDYAGRGSTNSDGFNNLKKRVHDRAISLYGSTLATTKEPQLRDKSFFEKLDEIQKRYLKLADRIATLDQKDNLKTQQEAMAYLYKKAGEKQLAEFVAGFYSEQMFNEIYDVLADNQSVVVLKKSPTIRI